jgi:hypothetical protein
MWPRREQGRQPNRAGESQTEISCAGDRFQFHGELWNGACWRLEWNGFWPLIRVLMIPGRAMRAGTIRMSCCRSRSARFRAAAGPAPIWRMLRRRRTNFFGNSWSWLASCRRMPLLGLLKGRRLFRALDPGQFRDCFQAFVARFAGNCRGAIAIVLRASLQSPVSIAFALRTASLATEPRATFRSSTVL